MAQALKGGAVTSQLCGHQQSDRHRDQGGGGLCKEEACTLLLAEWEL